MNKNKILIIYNKIWPYREIIFDLINKEYDLTVAFSDPAFKDKVYKFNTMYLPVKKIGPFEFHKHNLFRIAKNFDVVIGISNIRWVSLMLLCLKKNRNYRIGYWGIGVTASYKNKFDSKTTWSRIRYFISEKSDFTIFYSDYPVKEYVRQGVSKNKLFVAHNTTFVEMSNNKNVEEKENFLFVGSLYPQKGIDKLLNSYYKLYRKKDFVPKLFIVGDGEERDKIDKFVKENGLEEKVILFGKVYDSKILSEIFSESLVCISPNQAGLSVLTSMGNRTAFVTKETAITGGEIFNIEHMKNGIIYNRDEDLNSVMEWILENKQKVREMNKNALEKYKKYRTPQKMARSIMSAINFSLCSSH